jgi:hypothetical protein
MIGQGDRQAITKEGPVCRYENVLSARSKAIAYASLPMEQGLTLPQYTVYKEPSPCPGCAQVDPARSPNRAISR